MEQIEVLNNTISEQQALINELQRKVAMDTGSGTAGSYLTGSNNELRWIRIGNICIASLTLVIGSTTVPGTGSVLATGFPKPIQIQQGVVATGGSAQASVAVNANGDLAVWWLCSMTANTTYRGQVVYYCELANES